MPSERFFKLDSEKRKKIIQVSVEEFTGEGFQNASINKIIRKAEISRGSFYTYFRDKEDLFEFIFGDLVNDAEDHIILSIGMNRGDLFGSMKQMMGFALEPGAHSTACRGHEEFMEKILADFNIMEHLNRMFGETVDRLTETSGLRLLKRIYDELDDIREYMTFEDFRRISEMLMIISVKALISSRKRPEKTAGIKNTLFYQYDIIEKGIYGGRSE